jgi:hypothetical protein
MLFITCDYYDVCYNYDRLLKVLLFPIIFVIYH